MKKLLRLFPALFIICALLPAAISEGALNLPANLRIIDEEAFFGAENIGAVLLPDGVQEIRSRAFADSSLSSIALTSGLTFIADDAFDGCTVQIDVAEGSYAWDWCLSRGLIPAEWTSLQQTGVDSAALTLSLPAETTVSYDLLTLSDSGWSTIVSDITTPEFTIEGMTTDIESFFMLDVRAAQTVNHGDTALTFVYSFRTVPRTLTLTDCDYSFTIKNGEATLTGAAFWPDAISTEIAIPSSLHGYPVTAIAPGAFAQMNAVTKITVPEGISSIPESAFENCTALTTVELPASVTSIGDRAFAGCASLAEIRLPETLTFIADTAFDSCGTLSVTVSPGCAAWDWCIARGMTCAEWTGLLQTDSVSAKLSWIFPDGADASCSVLTGSDDVWTTVASGITATETVVSGLSTGTEANFKLEFTVSQPATCGETDFTFNYVLTTEPRTLTLLDCDYRWRIIDGEAILTGATLWPDTETVAAVFPAELDGYPVTAIDPRAFTAMSAFTSVTMPDTLRIIGEAAFYDCENLTAVDTGASANHIGGYAFADCPALTDVRLSDSITFIGECAFLNDSALTQIDLPGALCSLGRKALFGTGLTSVTLPGTLTEIGVQAWDEDVCEIITGEQDSFFTVIDGILYADQISRLVYVPRNLALTEYTAPDTVTAVDAFAFANCTALQTAAFPGGLTSIGDSAFSGCESLTDISGLDNLVTLGDRAFFGCASLTDSAFQNMTVLESVGAYSFSGCTLLENMPFPSTLGWLGEAAFENCTSLVTVSLGTQMSGIGAAAFYDCTALERVQMPESITDPEGLGIYLFHGCSSLTSVSIPSGVTKLGSRSFYECAKLASVTLPEGLQSIGSACFYKCTVLAGLQIPDSVTEINSTAFTYCKGLTELDLPACSIGSNAFAVCTSLKTVRISDKVVPDANARIGSKAFYYCTTLRNAYLPASVTSIEADSFSNCTKLTLHVEENTPAHTFAESNGLKYELILPEPTATPEVTATPEPTASPEPTATPEPTTTPEPTATPEPTSTPEPTVTPEATATPEPTATPAAGSMLESILSLLL